VRARPSDDVASVPTLKLEIHGLTKRYGANVALEPTTLDVRSGEFLTLLGPSGSGKTTLLMMIAGLTEPTAGRLLLDGSDITQRPAYRREIGVVFQNYALFPHLSVFENVAFPLRMRRRAERDIADAVVAALALVQLPHLAQRLPRELSGGQQQRVAFARALVFRPSLVLMDEPLGALDKRLRDELKLEIRKLHRETGATIIYVTHDQEEAMLLSDRVCLMNNARVEQVDTPIAIYDRPRSRFAATFIGESNVLEGRCVNGGISIGATRLETAHAQRLPSAGETVAVLVRPERIALGNTSNTANRLIGSVTGMVDLGATRRLSVRMADGLTLEATTLGVGPRPAIGDRVTLSIDAADVVPLTERAE